VANARKRKQTIFSLQDGVNHITDNDNQVKHVTKYYKMLFGYGEGNAFEIDENLWPREDHVSEVENDLLFMTFS
jgi:hypothetical protein